jgi:antitoxin (DNA-binding transcriptional repressor) of toxin-antitoxin stability system
MTHESLFEARTIPELSQLVETITRTRREQVILLDGKPAARMVPLRHQASNRATRALVDTSRLAPVPESTLNDLLTRAPGTAQCAFTDDEIREAVDLDRVEAWHAKHA